MIFMTIFNTITINFMIIRICYYYLFLWLLYKFIHNN